jgi:hypothetical protein
MTVGTTLLGSNYSHILIGIIQKYFLFLFLLLVISTSCLQMISKTYEQQQQYSLFEQLLTFMNVDKRTTISLHGQTRDNLFTCYYSIEDFK